MDEYIGAICFFVGDYAPEGYLFCDGTIYSQSQYPDLFNVLKGTYGGDGQTTFAVPDLNARIAMGLGPVPGTPLNLPIAKKIGESTHQLTNQELPAHNHSIAACSSAANSASPVNMVPASASIPSGRSSLKVNMYQTGTSSLVTMNAFVSAGQSQAHNNMQPYLGCTFIICAQNI